MSKKTKLCIILLFIIIIAFILVLIIMNTNTKTQENEINSIGTMIIKNTESENKETVQIYDKSNKDSSTIKIEDLNVYKIIGNTEDTERIIDSVIYSSEAQKRNIELSDKQNEKISKLANSSDVIYNVDGEENKEYIKEQVFKYLQNVEYELNLKKQILEEIKTNSISIDDVRISKLEEEYISLQEEAKSITDDQEKEEQFVKIYAKIDEIQNIYYAKIKENYIVEKDWYYENKKNSINSSTYYISNYRF